MIKEVDITEFFSEENLFLIKIKSNSLCYQKFSFCENFCQIKDGKKIAFINFLNKNATLFALPDSDFEELKTFLLFKGVNNVFCDDFVSQKLKITPSTKGFILKYSGNATRQKSNSFCFFPDYKIVYNLLKNDFEVSEYNHFVSDLSYRVKNGFSKLIYSEKGIIFSGWETENRRLSLHLQFT